MNPLARILAASLTLLALAGAFFFGLVVLALAVGLGLLAWSALALRLWWLRRQGGGRDWDGAAGNDTRVGPAARQGQVIDADYEVLSRRDDP
jgi:uncharacterized iron-regulated membrane protein